MLFTEEKGGFNLKDRQKCPNKKEKHLDPVNTTFSGYNAKLVPGFAKLPPPLFKRKAKRF